MILTAFTLAILANHANANDNTEIQYDEFGVSIKQDSLNKETSTDEHDYKKEDGDMVNAIESIDSQLTQLEKMAKEIDESIPPTGDLSTKESIKAERDKMEEYKKGPVNSKIDSFNQLLTIISEKISSIDHDVIVRVSDIGDAYKSKEENSSIENIDMKYRVIKDRFESASGFVASVIGKMRNKESQYKDAELTIGLAEKQEMERNQVKLAKEAQIKKTEEFRKLATLNEEEYFVPLFSCRAKDAMWCFSSSHKVYAITGYVSTDDTNKKNAAVYSEVGQGEVQDYTKESASAVDSFGWIENIAISGTRGLPHVYMARDRR